MPAKLPGNFFSARSPVIDLFRGQLDYADHLRQDSDVVLYFFYAPWCGQSIAAREEIEHVATRLSDQVTPEELRILNMAWWLGNVQADADFCHLVGTGRTGVFTF